VSTPAPLPDPAGGLELGPEETASLLDHARDGRLRIIDCREDGEWRINRLPEALHVPLSRFAEAAAPLVEDGLPAIVYCHHGMRSLRAAAWLRARGLEAAWSMSGGIDAWSDRVDPAVPKY
jgi:rhodanese-related sulfurtransferase